MRYDIERHSDTEASIRMFGGPVVGVLEVKAAHADALDDLCPLSSNEIIDRETRLDLISEAERAEESENEARDTLNDLLYDFDNLRRDVGKALARLRNARPRNPGRADIVADSIIMVADALERAVDEVVGIRLDLLDAPKESPDA